jgi:hypothetical protein
MPPQKIHIRANPNTADWHRALRCLVSQHEPEQGTLVPLVRLVRWENRGFHGHDPMPALQQAHDGQAQPEFQENHTYPRISLDDGSDRASLRGHRELKSHGQPHHPRLVQSQRRLRPNPPPTNLRISRSTTAPMKALMIRATMPTPR